MEEKKLLTLEDVLAGVEPIVQADPLFVYPQQPDHDEDDRCLCVENDTIDVEDYYEMNYDTSDCPCTLTTTTPVVM